MIRVGFIFDFSENGWLGGVNYIRNLLLAVEGLPDRKIAPVLFFGRKANPNFIALFPQFEAVHTSAIDRRAPLWFFRKVLHKTIKREIVIEKILHRHKIDVVSHFTGFGPKSDIRSIGWIPDFQHLHLPQFFSESDIKIRNKGWRNLAYLCDWMILSSQDAYKDFIGFLPDHRKRSSVLHFSATGINEQFVVPFDILAKTYPITSNYFHLPNQFWAHKNHRIVIDALSILKGQGRELLVVSTGGTSDFRNPDYFSSLMRHAQEKRVSDCFKVLGVVPFEHVQSLMQHSVAVINPSLFEGWSTTVEEAKSMGKKILLSDIHVHKEQSPERGQYFGVNDPDTLAQLMGKAIDDFNPNEEAIHQTNAIESHTIRVKQFAHDYEQIVKQVIRTSSFKCL